MSSYNSRWPSFIAFAVVSAILFAWVEHYGPVWPRKDSFFYLVYLDRIQGGSMSLGQFLEVRNNEHLVAVQYTIALASLKLFGMNFRPMLFENLAFLILFGVLIFAALSRSSIAKRYTVLTPLAVAVPLLNPSQASYLLWEFQTWFYYTLTFLAAAFFLIERYRLRAYPAVLLICVLATGSEAQGSFLWLVSGIHLFWLSILCGDRKARIQGSVVLAVHVAIFLALSWLLLHSHYVDTATDAIVHGGEKPSISARVIYFTTLLGGGFGMRNATAALALGSVSILAWFIFTIAALRQRFDSVETRIAFVLTGIALLWNLAFTVARENLGIAWAFGEFHASPMLLPFFIGLAVYALHAASDYQSEARKIVAPIGLLLSVLPLATGAATAHTISVDVRLSSMMAAALECNHASGSHYLRLGLVGIDDSDTRYAMVDRYRPELCASQADSAQWLSMLAPPAKFTALMAGDPHTKAALIALWDVYLTHNDLRDAFKQTDPELADKLLGFAAWSAKQGSTYEPAKLHPFADVYERFLPA